MMGEGGFEQCFIVFFWWQIIIVSQVGSTPSASMPPTSSGGSGRRRGEDFHHVSVFKGEKNLFYLFFKGRPWCGPQGSKSGRSRRKVYLFSEGIQRITIVSRLDDFLFHLNFLRPSHSRWRPGRAGSKITNPRVPKTISSTNQNFCFSSSERPPSKVPRDGVPRHPLQQGHPEDGRVVHGPLSRHREGR